MVFTIYGASMLESSLAFCLNQCKMKRVMACVSFPSLFFDIPHCSLVFRDGRLIVLVWLWH